jgi:hypothetical protein
MKIRWLLIVPFLFFLLASCQSNSNVPAEKNSATGQPVVTQAATQAPKGKGSFDVPGNPIDVSLTLDGAGVSQLISSSKGGSLSVSTADGTKYTLTVPAKALLVDTEIKLIPISVISGLPFSGGLVKAVKLEPNGLTFDQFVTLKVETTQSIALEKQILFGFEADGEDLHLAPPGADPKAVEIRLLHFSGAGVAEGTSEAKAAVYKRMADRVEARLTNETSKYLQDLRDGKVSDLTGLQAYFDEYYNSVVVPRLKAAAAASGSCADGTKALQTYLGWSRQLQLLGVPTTKDKGQNVLAEYGPIIAKKCFDAEFDRCANQHLVAGMVPALLSFERQGELLGTLNAAEPANASKDWVEAKAYGDALMRKCFQWDLEFSSAGNFTVAPDGYDSSVSAKIPIRVEGAGLPLDITLTGKSALINKSFTFHSKTDNCEITSNRGGGEFQVAALTWMTTMKADPDGTQRFYVKDFQLAHFPGNTSENITIQCWNPDPPHEKYPEMRTPPSPMWTATFIVNHYKEITSGNKDSAPPAISLDELMAGAVPAGASGQTFLAQDWKVNAAEVMGNKTWQGNSDLDAQVFEGGEFRLIHRPQK